MIYKLLILESRGEMELFPFFLKYARSIISIKLQILIIVKNILRILVDQNDVFFLNILHLFIKIRRFEF
jgi:hypothetical protein